jgi:hypothetical protein
MFGKVSAAWDKFKVIFVTLERSGIILSAITYAKESELQILTSSLLA